MNSWLLMVLLLGAATTEAAKNNETIPGGGVSCESPFQEVGGRCLYVDVYNTGSWDVMRSNCRSVGGDLAVLNDAEVYSALIRYIHGSGFPDLTYWIGATDEGHEGLWLWIDQEPVQLGTPYWANYGCDNNQMPTGEDNQNCAVLDSSYHLYFNDLNCNSNHYSVCEQ
ncbi:hypothetical protein OTU49_004165 [Cherax quadricarinatus]|uniref:C-type lectin domain-containing protein n=1 Tax=Cherax quadricarinatus TaxID=27406 RepID=A0AAW0YNP5_CHEQU|nr:C-type lectin domain family 17, member A-like [Cherax quadricarinatus]